MKKSILAIISLLFASVAAAQVPSFTPNIGLQVPAYGQSNWQVPLNYNSYLLDKLLSGNLVLPALSVNGQLQALGLTTWNPATSYATGNVVVYLGTVYQSLTSGNVANIPTPGAFWSTTFSSGGSTPCTSISNGVQFNNSGAFGCNSQFTFNPLNGILTAAGFATSSTYQGAFYLTQNSTAAPAAPANTFRWLAPQSGLTSSYDAIVPQLAPTSANSAMLCPNGGGQCNWAVALLGSVPAVISVPSNLALTLQTTTAGNGVAFILTPSSGSDVWQVYAGGSSFAQNFFVWYDQTANIQSFAVNQNKVWLPQTSPIGWSAVANTPGALDTQLARLAAGVIGLGTPANSGGSQSYQASIQIGGPQFTASGCSNGTLKGGSSVGSFLAGVSSTCTVTITMGDSHPGTNGWSCWANDETTPANVIHQTGHTTTTATISGTTVSGDTVSFGCIAY